MQCSIVQYVVQSSALKCKTQHNAVHHNTIEYNTIYEPVISFKLKGK